MGKRARTLEKLELASKFKSKAGIQAYTMFDYHVHTHYCRHAIGEADEYVKVAIRKGLKEMGFSDHYPMYYLPKLSYDDYSMNLEELPMYVKDIEEARRLFASEIGVKIGVEVDYYREKESILRRNLASLEFDYLIGVVHMIDDWVVDDHRNIHRYAEYDLNKLYSRYFKEVEALIRSGLFDIIGHIDVIKKFDILPEEGVEQYLKLCLDLILKKDLCVEINSSGLDRPIKDTFPGLNFLKKMYNHGIQVTLGSDAHHPTEVGRHFDIVVKALKKAGYSKVVGFNKREKELKGI